jgi:flagellar basal-body rod protein FlgG
MSSALEIAAVGMRAQQSDLDLLAANVSNINTPAYKRSELRFSELVAAGSPSSANEPNVVGVSQADRAMLDSQGQIDRTGNLADLAIDGAGFVELMGPTGKTLLWRGGTLRTIEDGRLATADGLILKANITVPREAVRVLIEPNGVVRAVGQDGTTEEIGAIELVRSSDSSAIWRAGGGVYEVGDTTNLDAAAPGEEGFGKLVQGAIERSNVDLNREMVDLLISQRAYAANAQVLKAADELFGIANGLRR